MLPVLENFSVKLSDLYYNWRAPLPCPSASLRAPGAGALVGLLGPLVPTALYNPTTGVCSLPQAEGGGATTVCSVAMADLCCCGGVAVSGYSAGAQEGTQFSRKVCPWGVRLAGLIGLYILLCFQQRSFRKHDLGQCATQCVSECSQRTRKLVVTVLQCSEAQSRRLETFIASWHYSDIQVAFLLYFIKIPVHRRLEI